MSDVDQWDIVDANNNSAPPDGFPEGMNYSAVNNAARAVMGGIARLYADNNGSLITGGTGNSYTLTTNQSIAAYVAGISLAFRVDRVNSGAATLNLNGIGPLPLRKESGINLVENDIAIGAYFAICDGSQFLITGSPSSANEESLADLPTMDDSSVLLTTIFHGLDSVGNDATATLEQVLRLIRPRSLTATLTAIAGDDPIMVADTSDSGILKGILESDLFGREKASLVGADRIFIRDSEDGNRIVSAPQSAVGIQASGDVTNGNYNIGSLQFRWGDITSTVDTPEVFTFTTPFSNECFGVITVRRGASAISDRSIYVFSSTASNFTIDRNDNVDGSEDLFYLAIGR